MGARFDTYLMDEVTSVGGAAFKSRSRDVHLSRTHNAGAVVASHSMGMIRQLCTAGAFLENGELTWSNHIKDAIAKHANKHSGMTRLPR